MQDATERSGSVLRYKGSPGRLRVSARHLDEALSTDTVPEHSFDRVEKLSPGQIVDVEIDLFPIGLAFHPGEQLRLIVTRRMRSAPSCRASKPLRRRTGGSTSSTGGAYASYLQMPMNAVEA